MVRQTTTLARLLLLLRTVRHLRLRQVLYRIYYRLRPLRLRPLSNCPEPRRWRGTWRSSAWMVPAWRDDERVELLGKSGSIRSQRDWNDPNYPKLWRYHLQYLDDLNAQNASNRGDWLQELVRRWINHNPPLQGDGWEPFPLSLRLVNLVKWCRREGVDETDIQCSIALQTQALMAQLEFHILGNHLFVNAKALVFVGAHFDGPRAAQWLASGLAILDDELDEQFLADGAHVELSPMYHCSMLWDLCDLINLARLVGHPELCRRQPRWIERLRRGLGWLREMLHPDGGIPFFNDAAFGGAPTYAELQAYAAQLGVAAATAERQGSVMRLEPSGYIAVQWGDTAKALIDVAAVGPSYQPGHAHADTLSFELSLLGQRVLVNSGTSQYGEDDERQRQRGTAAHNTVVINGQDSSEVWAGFRVARRANPRGIEVCDEPDRVEVAAEHDGYHRLPGRPTHRRCWRFHGHTLQVIDQVDGAYETLEARYHLHPTVAVTPLSPVRYRLEWGQGAHAVLRIENAASSWLETTTWHPRFGERIDNHCLVVTPEQRQWSVVIDWSLPQP